MPFDVRHLESDETHVDDVDNSIEFNGNPIINVGAYNRASYQVTPTEIAASTYVLQVEESNDARRWLVRASMSHTGFLTSSFEVRGMFHRVVPKTAADARVRVSVRLIAEG